MHVHTHKNTHIHTNTSIYTQKLCHTHTHKQLHQHEYLYLLPLSTHVWFAAFSAFFFFFCFCSFFKAYWWFPFKKGAGFVSSTNYLARRYTYGCSAHSATAFTNHHSLSIVLFSTPRLRHLLARRAVHASYFIETTLLFVCALGTEYGGGRGVTLAFRSRTSLCPAGWQIHKTRPRIIPH